MITDVDTAISTISTHVNLYGNTVASTVLNNLRIKKVYIGYTEIQVRRMFELYLRELAALPPKKGAKKNVK